MSLTHRAARREDLARIVEIYNATIPSRMVTADLEPIAVESRVRWFDEHTGRRPLCVVEREERVAAWLSFSPFYGRPAYDRTAELSIYIAEESRRLGLGSYLMGQALSHAPALGVDTVLGFVFGHNQPSLSLLDKFGFQRWGLLPRVAVLDGVERDVVILGRRV